MKNLIAYLKFAAVMVALTGSLHAQEIKTEWMIELEQLKMQLDWSDDNLDRMDYLRAKESVADCIMRMAQKEFPHLYKMLAEADAQYGSPLFYDVYGRDLKFVDAFDAEMKIRKRYSAWAKARGLD